MNLRVDDVLGRHALCDLDNLGRVLYSWRHRYFAQLERLLRERRAEYTSDWIIPQRQG
jgi:hypothetical protein